MKTFILLLLFPVIMYSQRVTKKIFANKGQIKEYRGEDVGKEFTVRSVYLQDRSILILRATTLYVLEDITTNKTSKIQLQQGAKIYYYGKCKIKKPGINKMIKKVNKL